MLYEEKIKKGRIREILHADEFNDSILNGYLETLRIHLKKYYKSYITEKRLEYELLK